MVSFYIEEERKKGRFIAVNSKHKWYYISKSFPFPSGLKTLPFQENLPNKEQIPTTLL